MQPTKPTILIIGGTGRMGQWFKNFFKSQSISVLIHGRKSKEKLTSLIKRADIIIVSVPISQTQKVIQQTIPHLRKDHLLIDISSLKQLSLETMKESPSGTLGLHPLFGPSILDTHGQKIVICRQKDNKHVKTLLDICIAAGMEIIEMSAKEHDRQMALIQGLTHAINILFAKTLTTSDIKLDPRIQTPLFKLQTLIMQRVLSQDPLLMTDIQSLNPNFISVLDELHGNMQMIRDYQENHDYLFEFISSSHLQSSNEAALAIKQTNKVLQLLEQKPGINLPKANQRLQHISLAYLGPDGTNTHQAALALANKTSTLISKDSMDEIVAAVEDGSTQLGVVPAENSLHGTVRETLDLLSDSSVQTIGSFDLPIHHSLLSLEKDLKNITKVISHPQALAQCKVWIQTNLPGVELIQASSTTSALVKPKKGEAYIASQIASDIYHVPILIDQIEDTPNNTTRFYVIAKTDFNLTNLRRGNSLLFLTIFNRVGILRDILDVFAKNNISLNKLESRPSPEKIWDYCFYIEVDQTVEHFRLKEAMNELGSLCSTIRILGRT